jgi:hypothetical protein
LNAILTVTPTVRAFRAEDAEHLLNRDGTQLTRQAFLRQAASGPSFTACVDEQPIGCAGVILLWPGVGSCWMLVTDELSTHGLWLTRTVKTFLREMIRVHRLHRLEATSVNGDNGRWLEVLGFTSERDGVARQYLTDRRNVVRYEWVRNL